MSAASPDRIRTLDLIRGVAVLGILAVNVASFAAPGSASFSPNLPQPGSTADNWAFAFNLVFFEGKMRALFSMLFGASLLLFIERREAQGRDGAFLQVRRLLWLALLGWLHFVLLWDGDILFAYACVGLGALLVRQAPPVQLVALALPLFLVWQAWGTISWLPSAALEQQVAEGSASPREIREYAGYVADRRDEDRRDTASSLSSYRNEVAARQAEDPAYPLAVLAANWGETLSYVMIGMALLGSGFLAGHWPRRRMLLLALGGTAAGLAATTAFALWAQPRGYPEMAMHMALGYLLSLPHLATALGYAALLVLAAPRVLETRLGQRIEAAGRMAFSNYLGTTLVMCAIFHGWGLGLFGRYGAAGQWPFVLLGWALMLGWSGPWLKRYRQGPLEWVWRNLAEWQLLPNRRT
ncbi:MAG: DUF418 domain-containing protein [Sphingomonadaceae bacterium]